MNYNIVTVMAALIKSVRIGIRLIPVVPLLIGIRLYQKAISRNYKVRQCRYNPSCSDYAFIALTRYGLRKGISLTRQRIARCNPDNEGGCDPVP